MDRDSKLEELNLTREEIDRFSNAFKQEKFRELLKEYAEEISNPENKKKYEEEITLMEQERGMDIKFVHPSPERVLKTSLDGKQKCFINVCSNELIGKPECEMGKSTDGKVGQRWSLPYSLTPGRPDMDSKGNKHMIYDVVFHPDTICIAKRNKRFMKLVDSTAIQGIQNQFKVKLDETNVKVLKIKYKGVPNASVIRKPIPGQPARQTDPNDPLRFPYPYDRTENESPKPKKLTKPAVDEPELQKKPTEPRYTVKYRSYIDLQDYRYARDSAPGPRPREIIITIDLPLLKSAGDADLNVTDRRLLFESQKPAYRLELPLSYPVDENKGEAKFNKLKGQLTVTLPVLPLKNTLHVVDLQQPVSSRESQGTGGSDGDKEWVKSEEVEDGDALPKATSNEHDCELFTVSVMESSPVEIPELLNLLKKQVSSYESRESLGMKPDEDRETAEECLKPLSSGELGQQSHASMCMEEVSQDVKRKDDEPLDSQDSSGESTAGVCSERPDAVPDSSLRWDGYGLTENISFGTEDTNEEMALSASPSELTLAKGSEAHSTTIREWGSQETSPPGKELRLQSQPLSASSEEDKAVFDTLSPTDKSEDAETTVPVSMNGGETEEVLEGDEEDLPTRQNYQSFDDNPLPVILREIDPQDGSVEVINDHTTSAAFSFQNTLLFDLD